MRRSPLALIIALVALSGCGGGGGSDDFPAKASAVGPIVKGPKGVWLFQPAGKPKNIVVYFHGQGGPVEATPRNHQPWIDHLVSRGSIVVYPRYELNYEIDPVLYALQGVQTAMKRVKNADKLPVLALGYSRGGAMALEYAAVAPGNGAPVPDEVISVFPAGQGNEHRSIDLSTLDKSTRLLIQIGTEDRIVDGAGARYLLRRLQAAGFPGDNIKINVVQGKIGFTSDHLAPLATSAGAKAAFWQPADRALDGLE